MELKVFWRTLVRRWYLTIVVVALTVGATAYVVRAVGPTYEAEGSTLVFPPASSMREEGETRTVGNPYLELAGVNQARDVVIRTLKSRTVQAQWGEAFPGMEYEVAPDFTNSAPIILFTVRGDTSDRTTAALEDLMGRVPQVLDDLQGGLGLTREGLVTARRLTQDPRPAVVRKSQIRAGLLTTAVAAGLGLLVLALADSLLVVHARRRAERAAIRAAERARHEEEDASRLAAEAAEADRTRPSYTYRIPMASEMAVSPARSTWLRSASADPRNGQRRGADGAPARLTGVTGPQSSDHGPRVLVSTTRSRNVSRNR